MSIPRRALKTTCLTLTLLFVLPSAAAWAEAPLPVGWQLLKVPGKPVTSFASTQDGVITVSAASSVGFLYRRASGIPGSGNFLTWRWRVDVTPPPTDLSVKGKEDRPLAVHVWFDNEDGSASDWSMTARLGSWFMRQPLPGKMLTYVWGGTAARGTTLKIPYRKSAGQIWVLRSGNSRPGQWLNETVDIAADFEAAFGYRPGKPAYIAISADTDDKGGESTGTVSGIAFTTTP
jgi:hypothetical protein